MKPAIYFDAMDSKKHLVVISDDDIERHKIEFNFITKGLEKNEISIYLTHGTIKSVEKEMESYGIDVNYFKKKGILKILHIENQMKGDMGFIEDAEVQLKKILPDPEKPFRIVGRAMPNVGTEFAIAIQVRLEEILHHDLFSKLNGSILCTYDLSQIQENNEWMKWLEKIKEPHHAHIIVKNGKASLTINKM